MEVRKYRIINQKNLATSNRIINEIKKIETVFNATLDKGTRVIYIECNTPEKDYKKEDYYQKLEAKILRAVRNYEKHASIESIDNKEVYRRVLYLRGLDCAYCGSRIENLAVKELNHEKIVVDYPTYRFIIETTDKDLVDHIIERVTEIAHRVDERIIVQSAEKGRPVSIEVATTITPRRLIMLGAGIIAYVIGSLLGYESIAEALSTQKPSSYISVILLLLGYTLVGHDVIVRFFKNLFKGRILDENFLMTIASVGAIVTGNYFEAVLVMLLYQIGETLQNFAVFKSRKSIAALLQYDVQDVKLKINDEIQEVGAEAILVDDIIVVGKGEMVPVDGIVYKGKTILDMKNITGESLAREVEVNNEILSGSINLGDTIEVRVTHTYNNSMMTRILELVENATINKAQTENFVTKFAKVYTPIVIILAGIIMTVGFGIVIAFSSRSWAIPFDWKDVVYAGMEFLVISCPCALVISIPLCFFSAIGVASKRGILIRGSNYLEALYNVENVVFDKTGTLTKGSFSILDIVPVESYKKEDVLRWLIYTEYFSKHPIGVSLVDQYGRDNIFTEIINDFQNLKGGAAASINGARIHVANAKLAKELGFKFEPFDSPYLVLYIFKDEEYVGAIIVGDIIREEAKEAIKSLRNIGVRKIYMLTGDSKSIAESVGKELGIDETYSELLPNQKVELIDKIKVSTKTKHGTTVYVGDGINDAPVIASADVGIAMGETASDATISISDVVIMTSDLHKITELAHLASATRIKVLTNIVFTLCVKLIVMLFTLLLGIFLVNLPLWIAILADVGVSLLAILNAVSLFLTFGKQNMIDFGKRDNTGEYNEY